MRIYRYYKMKTHKGMRPQDVVVLLKMIDKMVAIQNKIE